MNNETLLIVSLGLCLAMVVLATRTGFSAALGAFIMGSILAETVEAEHIEHIIQPVKDLSELFSLYPSVCWSIRLSCFSMPGRWLSLHW